MSFVGEAIAVLIRGSHENHSTSDNGRRRESEKDADLQEGFC